MIKVPVGFGSELQPLEVSSRRTIRSLLVRIRDLYSVIHDRFGADGLKLIEDVSEQYGREIAARARANDDPWTLKQISQFIVKVLNNIHTKGEVTEASDRRVAIRVDRCPYPFESCEICRAHTTMEHALVKGLNPDIGYAVEKSIPAGDEFCLHVIHSGGE